MGSSEKSRVKFIGRPVWAEIHLDALTRNLRAIKTHINPRSARRSSPRKVLAVVKANAYGLGAVPVSRALAKAGADGFGVTCVEEGAELREAGIRQPILVMTGFWPGEEKRLLEYRLTATITHCEQLRPLDRAAARNARGRRGPVDVHLKIDTGMNRLGISPASVECFARTLSECRHLRLAGTFTHFASSEVFTNEQTEQQQKLFVEAVNRLRALGLDPGILHLANSAGIVSRPETWADMVRPGAVLYGYHQNYDPQDRSAEAARLLPVEPVLHLRARVIAIRDVPSGQGVGYNARFVAERPSRIAVLSAGYADGLVRVMGNRGRVIVREKFAPVVGIVSMDLATVDVTGIEGVAVGDVATIFGSDGHVTLHVSEAARALGTVTSDLLCSLGQRVQKFYLP